MARRQRRNGQHTSSFQYGQKILMDALGMASTVLEGKKLAGAEKIDEIAAATRTFSESFDEMPQLQEYVEAAAASLESAATYISETDIRDMVEDLTVFAKRQPLATVALTAAAGAAFVQIMRTEGRMLRSNGRAQSRKKGGRTRTPNRVARRRSKTSADESPST